MLSLAIRFKLLSSTLIRWQVFVPVVTTIACIAGLLRLLTPNTAILSNCSLILASVAIGAWGAVVAVNEALNIHKRSGVGALRRQAVKEQFASLDKAEIAALGQIVTRGSVLPQKLYQYLRDQGFESPEHIVSSLHQKTDFFHTTFPGELEVNANLVVFLEELLNSEK